MCSLQYHTRFAALSRLHFHCCVFLFSKPTLIPPLPNSICNLKCTQSTFQVFLPVCVRKHTPCQCPLSLSYRLYITVLMKQNKNMTLFCQKGFITLRPLCFLNVFQNVFWARLRQNKQWSQWGNQGWHHLHCCSLGKQPGRECTW